METVSPTESGLADASTKASTPAASLPKPDTNRHRKNRGQSPSQDFGATERVRLQNRVAQHKYRTKIRKKSLERLSELPRPQGWDRGDNLKESGGKENEVFCAWPSAARDEDPIWNPRSVALVHQGTQQNSQSWPRSEEQMQQLRELPRPGSWNSGESDVQKPGPSEARKEDGIWISWPVSNCGQLFLPGTRQMNKLLELPRPGNWSQRDQRINIGAWESEVSSAVSPAFSNEDLTGNRDAIAVQLTPMEPILEEPLTPCFSLFTYQRLAHPDEIRVIVVSPGWGLDALVFTIQHVRLDAENTNFEALSYAWGERFVHILQDDRILRYPENLHDALLRVRHPNKARIIWADAICINQQDTSERGHQVRLMRRIYTRASKVLIWLGYNDAYQAAPAFELARNIARKQTDAIPLPEYPEWGALMQLLDQPWFSRLWCLQEIVLASSAEVFWGERSAPWDRIGFSADWICNVGYDVLTHWLARSGWTRADVADHRQSSQPSEKFHHPGIYRASLMHSLRLSQLNTSPAPSMPFLDLMAVTRPFSASDPRDKVFALLGIHRYDADFSYGYKSFLEPDYTLGVEQVYAALAQRVLSEAQNLQILGAVQPWAETPAGLAREHEVCKMPTWVPRWDRFWHRSLTPLRTSDEHGEENPRASAARSLGPALIEFKGPNNAVLVTSGLHFDIIMAARQLGTRDDFRTMHDTLACVCWANMMHNGASSYPIDAATASSGTTTIASEAFCWTITAGLDWTGLRVGSASQRAQHLADYSALRASWSTTALMFPPLPDASIIGDANRFYEAVCHACSNRVFFLTEKGYVGLAPLGSIVGDWVCVLSGAELPIALRLRERRDGLEEFEVLGEVYVHGIMDGEAGDEELGLERRKFHLV